MRVSGKLYSDLEELCDAATRSGYTIKAYGHDANTTDHESCCWHACESWTDQAWYLSMPGQISDTIAEDHRDDQFLRVLSCVENPGSVFWRLLSLAAGRCCCPGAIPHWAALLEPCYVLVMHLCSGKHSTRHANELTMMSARDTQTPR